MLKWILTLVVAIFLLGIIAPHLARFIRFGKLPGDFAFRFRGRDYTSSGYDDDHLLTVALAALPPHLACLFDGAHPRGMDALGDFRLVGAGCGDFAPPRRH
jgi:hypothetical protein